MRRNVFPSRGTRRVLGSRRRSPPRAGAGVEAVPLRYLGAQAGGHRRVLRNYWTNAERDLDGALTEHFHLLLHEDRYNDDAFCARLQRWQREMGADGYIRQLKALAADYSTEDLLPRITADTLVIHGRQDRVVVEEEVEFLAEGIAGAALALSTRPGTVPRSNSRRRSPR